MDEDNSQFTAWPDETLFPGLCVWRLRVCKRLSLNPRQMVFEPATARCYVFRHVSSVDYVGYEYCPYGSHLPLYFFDIELLPEYERNEVLKHQPWIGPSHLSELARTAYLNSPLVAMPS